MKPRVALIGTFEVANYGDLLFPLITQRELGFRRGDLEFSWFGPVGSESSGWPTVMGLGPFSRERVERLAEICDAAVIGGGDLIRSSDQAVAPSYGLEARDAAVWRPSAWFGAGASMADVGLRVAWNGVGVTEPMEGLRLDGISYLSVRDGMSRDYLGESLEQIKVVPDIAFLMDEVWSAATLAEIHARGVERGALPDEAYVVIQASRWVSPRVDLGQVRAMAAGRPVVVVQVGPCHGDEIMVERAQEGLGDQARVFPHPCALEDVAAAIAHADAYVGNSLHGAITSLVYDTPFRLLDLDGFSKREAVLATVGVGVDHLVREGDTIDARPLDRPAVWDRETVRQRLSEHFDQLASHLPVEGHVRAYRWDDRPSVLHLGLAQSPRPPEFTTEVSLEVSAPPPPPDAMARVLRTALDLQRKRSDLGEPGQWIADALGISRPTTMEGWDQAIAEMERLRSSLIDAEAGWAQTVSDNEELRSGVEAAEAGWAQTVSDNEELRNAVEAAEEGWREAVAEVHKLAASLVEEELARLLLEDRVIATPDSWLVEVSGPPIMVLPPELLGNGSAEVERPIRSVGMLRGEPDLKFSILTPVYNPEASFLTSCLRSVRDQTYPNWEMVVFDASDAAHVAPICERFAQLDDRFRVFKGPNNGISHNTNIAADEATGDWIILLDHDDELAGHALQTLAAAIATEPEARFVYSDEDKIDDRGRRTDTFLKPDWSPDLLRHVNYITHLQAVRRDLWDEVGGLRSGYDGAQDYDLALRASWEAGGALHVPEVLYHWRVHDSSTAQDVSVKPRAHHAGRWALEDFVAAHVPGARVGFGTGPTSHRLRYPLEERQVSVVIPFRDNWKLTETCLEGIYRFGSTLPLEVLLVDNRSSKTETAKKILEWTERFADLRVVSYDHPFNFQALNNWAVEQTGGDLLLFLNNDVEPIHQGWIEAMAEHAQRAEVGAVGARLFYPNGLIQHAGVAVGIGGYADHPWAGLGPKAWTPAGPSYWTRNFLAVTAACLMIERSKFEDVGGFDERFVVGGGDVALGIALHGKGLWNVYTPFARLIHHESMTRAQSVPESDLEISKQVYAPFLDGRDPFYNPNLTLWGTSCSVASEAELAEKLIPAPASR